MIYIFSYILYYILVSIGITFGYHRYFSHKEFNATKFQEIGFLLCGVLCGGRDPISWVGVHRMHHQYSDTDDDPQPSGWKALFSVWKIKTVPRRFVKDLYANPRVVWFHKYHKYVWLLSAILFLPIIEVWLIIQFLSWLGFGTLNCFGHWNNKPTNNLWLNVIAPFEGNHADHHKTKPTSLDTIRF